MEELRFELYGEELENPKTNCFVLDSYGGGKWLAVRRGWCDICLNGWGGDIEAAWE